MFLTGGNKNSILNYTFRNYTILQVLKVLIMVMKNVIKVLLTQKSNLYFYISHYTDKQVLLRCFSVSRFSGGVFFIKLQA